MENFEIISELQTIIDNEFSKFLKVNLNGKVFHIAISKSQIPKIRHFGTWNDDLIISFSDLDLNSLDTEELKILTNKEGEISALIIPEPQRIKNVSFIQKFDKFLKEEVKKLPSSNNDEELLKHKQKRVAHALSNILKKVASSEVLHLAGSNF